MGRATRLVFGGILNRPAYSVNILKYSYDSHNVAAMLCSENMQLIFESRRNVELRIRKTRARSQYELRYYSLT